MSAFPMEDYDKLRYVVTYDKRPIMEHNELRPTMAGNRPDEHTADHSLAILRSGFELGDLHFDITYYDEAIGMEHLVTSEEVLHIISKMGGLEHRVVNDFFQEIGRAMRAKIELSVITLREMNEEQEEEGGRDGYR